MWFVALQPCKDTTAVGDTAKAYFPVKMDESDDCEWWHEANDEFNTLIIATKFGMISSKLGEFVERTCKSLRT